MMKIYILIPIKNQSARLDGKNMMLLPFTLAWIEREVSALPARIRDAVRVATFGNIPRSMQKSIERYGVEHVKLPYHQDKSHQSALENACAALGVQRGDIVVMLQVTQPLRRSGMLYDAIKAARGGHPVISASRMRADGRIIGADGKRIPCQPESILFYDGAIYAGNLDNMGIWFTLESASKVIINQDMSVCDIDTPLDLLNHTRFTL